jgi:hypothetical protein
LKQGKLPTDSEVMKLAMGPGREASFEEVFETGAIVLEVVQIVFNSAFHYERMSTQLVVGRVLHHWVFDDLTKCRNDGEVRSALIRCGYPCEF